MSGDLRADYTRTCEGCQHIVVESWDRDRVCYRCYAPGRCQGYVVGVERFLPYIPAWCPEMKENGLCTKN